MGGPTELRYHIQGLGNTKQVALTFDDGPNPPRTEQVLEILASAGAHASFFVLGRWVERWPRTVERILAGGHTVANHGYSHGAHVNDYERAEAIIGHVTGAPTRFLRAAYYHYDACALSPLAHRRVVIDQMVSSNDWRLTDAEEIYHAVVDSPQLGSGAIVGFHDSSEAVDDLQRLSRPIPMLEALPTILAALKSRGFELVSLDELTLGEPLVWRDERDPREKALREGVAIGRP